MPDDANSADEVPRSRKSRRVAVACVSAALVVALILIAVWVRYSIVGGNDRPNENLTTTTDPFAHIDRNQSVDNATVASTDMNATDMNATAELQAPSPPSDWDYSESFDQVRNATIYHASLESENAADFDFPYQGGSKLTMTVRWHPKYGQDVIFKISKGQFVCGVEDCSGTINFGSGPQTISLSEPTDNSSDTLFISDASDVIDQLKKTKRVVVELPFYQEGNRQFTFEMTSFLAWPPNGAEAKALATEDDNTIKQ